MKSRNWLQSHLAAKSGVGPNHLSLIMRSVVWPNIRTLFYLAEAVDCNLKISLEPKNQANPLPDHVQLDPNEIESTNLPYGVYDKRSRKLNRKDRDELIIRLSGMGLTIQQLAYAFSMNYNTVRDVFKAHADGMLLPASNPAESTPENH